MNEFMKTLLSLSVSGTLLLLLILGLKQLYKNKFSKRWQYYIWIIVALRFLLPFTPNTTIVGSLFEMIDTISITNEAPTSTNVPVSVNVDNSGTEPIQTDKDITAVAMREPFNIYICLFLIWSVLALVLFVRKITIYQGFIQYIKAGSTAVSDIKILNLLSDCQEKLNIKTRVELSHNSLIASPMMIGFFRPNIVLPVGELEDKELSYIFVHELIHYKQKDMFYKWLIQIVVCAHWFNPFVYLLEKEVNKSCELSCDEKVLSILDDKSRREYGDTLISFLKSNNLYKSSLASVTLTEGAEQLKERLGAIMEFQKSSKTLIVITTILTTIFTLALCFCFFVIGAYAYATPVTDKESLLWENENIIPEPVEANEEVWLSGITKKNEMTIYPRCIFPMSKGNIFYIKYNDSVSGTFNVGLIDENGKKIEAENTIWQEGDTASIEVSQDGSYYFYVEGFNDDAGWVNTGYKFIVSYE